MGLKRWTCAGAIALAGGGCASFTESPPGAADGTTTATATANPSPTSTTSADLTTDLTTGATTEGTTGGSTSGRPPPSSTGANSHPSTSSSSTMGHQPTTSGSSTTPELPGDTGGAIPDPEACAQIDEEPNDNPLDLDPTSVECGQRLPVQVGTALDPDDHDWFAIRPDCAPRRGAVLFSANSTTPGFLVCVSPVCNASSRSRLVCHHGLISQDGGACCQYGGTGEQVLAEAECEDGSVDQTGYILQLPWDGEAEAASCTPYELLYYAFQRQGLESTTSRR